MSVDLDKPWQACSGAGALPGHMGVFQLADGAGAVVYIGYAGGRSRFGLRGEVEAAAARLGAVSFRCEVTTAYLTRYQELLMVHRARHGVLPTGNGDVAGLGRLSPG